MSPPRRPTRPAPAMAAQVRAQLARVGAKIEAADRQGASYAVVYRLVCLEAGLLRDLEQLEGSS